MTNIDLVPGCKITRNCIHSYIDHYILGFQCIAFDYKLNPSFYFFPINLIMSGCNEAIPFKYLEEYSPSSLVSRYIPKLPNYRNRLTKRCCTVKENKPIGL